MESMNISLPEPMMQFVDGEIQSGRYGSAREYVRDLIAADEKRKAEDRFEALLLEGVEGSEEIITAEDLQAIRQEAVARVQEVRNSRA